MTDVLFYHLEHKPWEQVLPRLLAAASARGWRSIVQTGDAARIEHLSDTLWTSDADIFLAHGSEADGKPALQPIWLTAGRENPNGASVRFFIDGAPIEDVAGLTRAVVLFDGLDESAVGRAREDWKRLRTDGHEISYWQQDESMRWVNRSAGG
jgi:DNA polymerase III subunit chi